MKQANSLRHDARLAEVERLSALEREQTRRVRETRKALADLVQGLLPERASNAHVNEVVRASGYNGTLITALRSGGHPWNFAPLDEGSTDGG